MRQATTDQINAHADKVRAELGDRFAVHPNRFAVHVRCRACGNSKTGDRAAAWAREHECDRDDLAESIAAIATREAGRTFTADDVNAFVETLAHFVQGPATAESVTDGIARMSESRDRFMARVEADPSFLVDALAGTYDTFRAEAGQRA